jgi:hypothetical protein
MEGNDGVREARAGEALRFFFDRDDAVTGTIA